MTNEQHETVRIEKTTKVCPMCEDYARRNAAKPVVVMCCEGACLRGEVARRAANLLCHSLAPERTVRLCLGGAFTKEGGQRTLAKDATRLVSIEGCFLECGARMIKGVAPDTQPEVIIADRLFDFDHSLFGIDEMPDEQITANAGVVADKALAAIGTGG